MCDRGCVGGDHGNGFAVVADETVGENRLIVEVQAKGPLAREIGREQDGVHAGQRGGRGRVDTADPRVRVW